MPRSKKTPPPKPEGRRVWIVPDAYLPPLSPEDEVKKAGGQGYWSHESLCIVNTGPKPARVSLNFYFEDRPAVKSVRVTVGAERTWHIRFDKPELLGGFRVPAGVPYALRVESDVPVVVQHSRLDTTQMNCAFLSVMAHPVR
jgi:hypothetical protein